MKLTMVKAQFLLINLLCAITITISAKPVGRVKEFKMGNKEEKENAEGHPGKHAHAEPKAIVLNKIENLKTTVEMTNNNAADSIYTESDWEEAVSGEIGGQNPKENERKVDEETGLKEESKLLDVYTESDLDETVSQDNERHEIDKRSANSYLYVPANDNGYDGSGEGSGDFDAST